MKDKQDKQDKVITKNENSKGRIIAQNGYNEEHFIKNTLNADIKLLKLLEQFTNETELNNAIIINNNSKTDILISNLNIQHKKTKINQFGQIHRGKVDTLINDIPELKNCQTMLKQLCELPIDEKQTYAIKIIK